MKFKFEQQEKLVQQIADKQREIVTLQDLLNTYTRIQDTANNAIASVKEAFDQLQQSGIDQDSFIAWQKAVIKSAGVEDAIAVDPQVDVEAIEVLQKENASLIAKIEKMEQAALISAQKINELQIECSKLKEVACDRTNDHTPKTFELLVDAMVGAIAVADEQAIDDKSTAQDAIAPTEQVTEQATNRINKFNKGDIVQLEDERVCTVVYDSGCGEHVLLRMPNQSAGNFHRSGLKLISAAPVDGTINTAESAIAQLPSDDELIAELVKQNPLSWQEIQIFCKGEVAKLELIQNHKKSKKLAKQLAGMYENHLIETGDISDKSWLPQEFLDLLSDGVPF